MPPRGSLQQTPGAICSPSTESATIFDIPRRARNTTRRLNNSAATAALSVHFNRALANSVDSLADSIVGPAHSSHPPVDSHSSLPQPTHAPRSVISVRHTSLERASSSRPSLTYQPKNSRLLATPNSADEQTAPPLVDGHRSTLSLESSSSPSLNQSTNNNTPLSRDQHPVIDNMGIDIISSTYAALVATGGIIGYAKAGSIPSLTAGLTFGGILGVGAYLTSVNPSNYNLTFGTSAVLGGMMGLRAYRSGKFLPAGLIALLSLGMVARYSYITLTNVLDKERSP